MIKFNIFSSVALAGILIYLMSIQKDNHIGWGFAVYFALPFAWPFLAFVFECKLRNLDKIRTFVVYIFWMVFWGWETVLLFLAMILIGNKSAPSALIESNNKILFGILLVVFYSTLILTYVNHNVLVRIPPRWRRPLAFVKKTQYTKNSDDSSTDEIQSLP